MSGNTQWEKPTWPLSLWPPVGVSAVLGLKNWNQLIAQTVLFVTLLRTWKTLDSIFLQGVVIIFGVVSFMAVGIHFIIILREISL